MRIGDEDLVQALSASLTKEIGDLPDDGKDHELRIKIRGRGNNTHINLGTQTFEIRSGKEPPPLESDRARSCPQCGKSTWRYTQLCMHCDYNLHNHDQVEADHRAKQQAEQRRKETNTFLLKTFIVSASVAISGFSLKGYFPDTLQHWVIGVSVVAGLLAFVILQSAR
ncbi:hypothetical protein [Pseudomonas sp. MRSN 12121]|uniref:hypothetical protein n=1 Tax=Pseudomonas sp. MRSN 12121 TaxID=1611770 RepID=UPI0012E04E69|nr:hypothetical protein [Pseudomonas sp. MRSN 12121]